MRATPLASVAAAAIIALALTGCGLRPGHNGESPTSSAPAAAPGSPAATPAPEVDPLAEVDTALADIDGSMGQSESDLAAGSAAAATADE
jgi:hypothetical protein